MKSNKGHRYHFDIHIQSLECNANASPKTSKKTGLASIQNLGKFLDPMNLLEPILSKKVALTCRRGAAKKGSTKNATFNPTKMAYEWDEPQHFQFTSVLIPQEKDSYQSKVVKFRLTKVNSHIGTKVSPLASASFDLASDLKPHLVTLPIMNLTKDSFSEVLPQEKRRLSLSFKKESISAGVLELKFFITPKLESEVDNESHTMSSEATDEASDGEDDIEQVDAKEKTKVPMINFFEDHFLSSKIIPNRKTSPDEKKTILSKTPPIRSDILFKKSPTLSPKEQPVMQKHAPLEQQLVTQQKTPIVEDQAIVSKPVEQPIVAKPEQPVDSQVILPSLVEQTDIIQEPIVQSVVPEQNILVITDRVDEVSSPMKLTAQDLEEEKITVPQVEELLSLSGSQEPQEGSVTVVEQQQTISPVPQTNTENVFHIEQLGEEVFNQPVVAEPHSPVIESQPVSNIDHKISQENVPDHNDDMHANMIELEKENNVLQNQLMTQMQLTTDLKAEIEMLQHNIESLQLHNKKLKAKVEKRTLKVVKLRQKVERERIRKERSQDRIEIEYHPVLVAVMWGLIASLLSACALPYITVATSLQTIEAVVERSLSLTLGTFLYFSLLSYFGVSLAKVLRIQTSCTQLLNFTSKKWDEKSLQEFTNHVRTSCLWGLCIGLGCKIFDGIFFSVFVGYEGHVDTTQISFLKRMFFGIYEGVTSELFGRFFCMLLCMNILQHVQIISTTKKEALPSAVIKVLETIEQFVKSNGQNIDVQVIASILISTVVYVFWRLSWQLTVYPVDGLVSYLLALLRVFIMEGITGAAFGYMFFVEEKIELTIIAHIVKELVVHF